jgi:hypothetical protein
MAGAGLLQCRVGAAAVLKVRGLRSPGLLRCLQGKTSPVGAPAACFIEGAQVALFGVQELIIISMHMSFARCHSNNKQPGSSHSLLLQAVVTAAVAAQCIVVVCGTQLECVQLSKPTPCIP